MPHSDRRFDDVVVRWIRSRIKPGAPILDIGAGSGKFGEMLGGAYHMIALEIHGPYIDRYNLLQKYRGVVEGDARDITVEQLTSGGNSYGLIIIGDVLEHLSEADALNLLSKVRESKIPALVVVPYNYVQSGTEENPHEEHLQPDLTEDIFLKRYRSVDPIPLINEAFGGVWIINSPDPFKYADQVDICKEDLENVRLAICTPQPGKVETAYLTSMMRTVVSLVRLDIPFTFIAPQGSIIDKMRNLAIQQALDHPLGVTHILFIDSDQGWQADDLIRLLWKSVKTGKELLAYVSIKKSERNDWAVCFLGTRGAGEITDDGTIEVEAVGTGFMLLSRSIFPKMFAAYPKLAIYEPSPETGELKHSPNAFALFQTALDDAGRYIGEDLTFCHRWRAIGGRVWVDPTADLEHVGAKTYRGSLMLGIMPDPNPVQK